MITAGTFVPYIPQVDTVRAKVLGLCRNGEQYMLRIEYMGDDPMTGQRTLIVKEFQRDRRYIETRYQEASRLLGY